MTTALSISTLPYSSDPLQLFDALRQRPGAVLLDSGRPVAQGRFDIISSDPLATLEVSAEGVPALITAEPEFPALPSGDSFAQQQWLLEQLPFPCTEAWALDSELPFMGGLIGYWGYDLGRERLIKAQQPDVTRLPQARLGLYDWCITLDHVTHEAWLIATDERREQVLAWLQAPPAAAFFNLTEPFKGELERCDYAERFAAVQRYIRAGDCYQINLAQRFSAAYEGDEWQAYLRLRNAHPFLGVYGLGRSRRSFTFTGTLHSKPQRPGGNTPDQGHPATGRHAEGRRGPCRAAIGQHQGPRRERDDR